LSAGRALSLGYKQVWVMSGGRQAWDEAGFPLVADEPAERSAERRAD
jgi:3-mercaptopyruvate sulfurtransferase SseA